MIYSSHLVFLVTFTFAELLKVFEAFALSLVLETSQFFIGHETISKGSRFGVGSLIVSKGLARASKPVSGVSCLFFKRLSLTKTHIQKEICSLVKAKEYQKHDAFIALQNSEENGLLYYFNRYYSPLLLYANSITRHHEVAQEIVSDAFQKLWCNRHRLSDGTRVKAYLYRLASNAAIDYLRHQKSERKRASLYTVKDADDHNILQKMIETEVYDQLYRVLSQLPGKPRRIFELFYFEKKSIQEIATELGTTPDAVKSQKKRAMQILRESRNPWLLLCLLCLCIV